MNNPKVYLPEGYQVVKHGRKRALLNPRGEIVLSRLDAPISASELEEIAWRDVWREIERNVKRELFELRAGIRAANDLERLAQYGRLLEAIEGRPEEPRETPRRRSRLPVGTVGSFALFLAGTALILLARNVSSLMRLHQP